MYLKITIQINLVINVNEETLQLMEKAISQGKDLILLYDDRNKADEAVSYARTFRKCTDASFGVGPVLRVYYLPEHLSTYRDADVGDRFFKRYLEEGREGEQIVFVIDSNKKDDLSEALRNQMGEKSALFVVNENNRGRVGISYAPSLASLDHAKSIGEILALFGIEPSEDLSAFSRQVTAGLVK